MFIRYTNVKFTFSLLIILYKCCLWIKYIVHLHTKWFSSSSSLSKQNSHILSSKFTLFYLLVSILNSKTPHLNLANVDLVFCQKGCNIRFTNKLYFKLTFRFLLNLDFQFITIIFCTFSF